MKPRESATIARVWFLLIAMMLASPVAGAVKQDSLQAVSEALTCQCGCGLTVANCNHPQCEFSVPVRDQIEKMLNRGMARTQIIAEFRHKYGEKILSAPTTEGFNLVAWIMPFAALTAGFGLIFAVVGRWHRNAPASDGRGEANDEGAGFDPELVRRLERELKERT